MAVRIRLKRLGARHRAFYRVIAADSKSPRDGRFIETLGTYDPIPDPAIIKIKRDRLEHWLKMGALPTDSAQMVLRAGGLVDEKGKLLPVPAGVTEAPAEE